MKKKSVNREITELIAEYRGTPRHKASIRRLIKSNQKITKNMQNTLKNEKIFERKAKKGGLHSEVLAMRKLQKNTKVFIRELQIANKKLNKVIGK